jgi:hypothetical protein
MNISKPSTTPLPKPAPPPAPPELQIAPSRDFTAGLKSKANIVVDALKMVNAPGDTLNLVSGKKFREVREELDGGTPYTGVKRNEDGTATATDIRNPDSLDGKWDPFDYMPRFVFDKAEDAYPVSPTFDGDTDLDNNAADKTSDPAGTYKDGVIGGEQPLSGGFAVTKKGEYTVLSYSFYYAHNKAGDYHNNDYSTAQVYLKPGEDGKLEPAYMATSWHHGAELVPWKDLKKDEDGRPIVGVDLGSHALEVRDSVPEGGLQIRGNGDAELNGKPIDQRLGFEAFQKNIDGATYLDPATPGAKPRLDAMTWGEMALNPFLPEVFHDAPSAWQQLLGKGVNAAEAAVEKGWDKTTDVVESVVDKAESVVEKTGDVAESVVGKAGDVAKGGLDKAKDFFSGL